MTIEGNVSMLNSSNDLFVLTFFFSSRSERQEQIIDFSISFDLLSIYQSERRDDVHLSLVNNFLSTPFESSISHVLIKEIQQLELFTLSFSGVFFISNSFHRVGFSSSVFFPFDSFQSMIELEFHHSLDWLIDECSMVNKVSIIFVHDEL